MWEAQQIQTREAEIRQAQLQETEARRAELREAERRDAERQQAEIRDRELRQAEIREAEARRAELRQVEIQEAERRQAEIRDFELRQTEVREVEARRAELREVETREAERRQAEASPIAVPTQPTDIAPAVAQPMALHLVEKYPDTGAASPPRKGRDDSSPRTEQAVRLVSPLPTAIPVPEASQERVTRPSTPQRAFTSLRRIVLMVLVATGLLVVCFAAYLDLRTSDKPQPSLHRTVAPAAPHWYFPPWGKPSDQVILTVSNLNSTAVDVHLQMPGNPKVVTQSVRVPPRSEALLGLPYQSRDAALAIRATAAILPYRLVVRNTTSYRTVGRPIGGTTGR